MILQVDRIDLREIQLPLREPFQISSGTTTDRRIVLLELGHPDGPSAWSECVAGELPNYFPDTTDTVWLAIREWLAPRVLGRPFERTADVAAALEKDVRGHLMARAAVEMGFWGLAAVIDSVPLAELIGGTRDRVATGISLGIQDRPQVLAEKARDAFEEGYRKVKIKIRPGEDVPFVRAVREAVGVDAPLAVDANAAYTLRDSDSLGALDGLGLLMIEQPLEGGDLVRHAELQRRLATPLCLDESITGLASAEDMIALGSGRIVNVKPGRVGGFLQSIAIHDVCEANGIGVWCGGMLESGIGRAYNVALASLPNFVFPGDLSPSHRYWESDVVKPEWTMSDDGYVTVPRDDAGLGVEVDRHRIEDLTVRFERLTRS
jgi:O-succinylbenzoate synthase